ncbi:Tiparp [Symbiodinium sp. KB8]|nr:Tiparp [Symbiodinium sp. KB8]
MATCFKCGTDASVGEVAVWDNGKWLWIWDSLSQFQGWWKGWTKMPQAVWNVPSSKIEASDIYCRSCWKEWAQHVKGSRYSLSRHCEKWAVQAGIQFVNPLEPSHMGNPFYCPPCGRFFNHGLTSLEKHLQDSHPDVVVRPSRKRKHEETAANSNLTPSAHHDPGGGNRGSKLSNWTAQDMKQPPLPSTSTAEIQNLQATDDGMESEFELVWEFQADNRCPLQDYELDADDLGDWRPMKKSMNDLLEKRWAQGWDTNPDLDDTFYVQGKGFSYRIDSHCMLQWNTSTGRVREIRRVDARSQATKKAAEVEQLLQEKADLLAKVAKLEQEKTTLEALQADHATQMMAQEAWRVGRQLQAEICIQLNHRDAVFASIQQALLEAWPSDHHGDCLHMNHFSIIGLQQVCNTNIWKDYEFRKEQVRKELEGRDNIPRITSTLPPQVCSWAHLDAKINEVLVIHGTTLDKTEQIAGFGFDGRLARETGLYGQGVYFTDQSCKALQYSGAVSVPRWGAFPTTGSGEGFFIIARVILGHAKDAEGPLKSTKVEPPVDPGDPSKGRFHSVIAQPGTLKNQWRRQVHREFVIFNGAQAYPELIVHFKTS